MKWGVVLFGWWFMTLGVPTPKVGPFDNEKECQKIREWYARQPFTAATSPCWDDGKGAR